MYVVPIRKFGERANANGAAVATYLPDSSDFTTCTVQLLLRVNCCSTRLRLLIYSLDMHVFAYLIVAL